MEQISKRLMNWASILEPQTRAQAEATATMPFIYPHLALMPDAHLGKGATVGSVIPTLGAIIPAAVGVDIGCGMMAVLTQLTAEDVRRLGNPHGAGRNYSRSKARKTFSRAQLDEAMTGIEWRHTDAFLDEIPQAYKPIDQVMADAAELVAVRHVLRQIVNVKGD
jgi:tRNA-splicing ligase RtcB